MTTITGASQNFFRSRMYAQNSPAIPCAISLSNQPVRVGLLELSFHARAPGPRLALFPEPGCGCLMNQ
jgi:hypothetical protein